MVGAASFVGFPFPTVADAAPPPIPTGGLVAWFDATQGISTDGATLRVASWAPRGGTAGVATQATTAAMPVVSTMNGLPSVSFDGADDVLALATGAGGGDTMSAFVVGRVAEVATNHALLGGTVTGAPLYYVLTSGAQRLNLQNGATICIGTNGKVVSGATFQCGVTFNRNGGAGGPYAMRFNRAADASGTASVAAFAGGFSILGAQGAANFWSGLISEAIVYGRVLSAAEIAQVEGYLAAKWGTP